MLSVSDPIWIQYPHTKFKLPAPNYWPMLTLHFAIISRPFPCLSKTKQHSKTVTTKEGSGHIRFCTFDFRFSTWCFFSALRTVRNLRAFTRRRLGIGGSMERLSLIDIAVEDDLLSSSPSDALIDQISPGPYTMHWILSPCLILLALCYFFQISIFFVYI